MLVIDFARNTPYRHVFKRYVGKFSHTLSDESFALAFQVATFAFRGDDDILDRLPTACKDHFKRLRKIKAGRRLFFVGFMLFNKSTEDAILVGFGRDGMYYVVATMDDEGCDLWTPEYDLHDSPVSVDGQTKAVVCLSCHQKVEVKLVSYGSGHIADCPKCTRLAYNGD